MTIKTSFCRQNFKKIKETITCAHTFAHAPTKTHYPEPLQMIVTVIYKELPEAQK